MYAVDQKTVETCRDMSKTFSRLAAYIHCQLNFYNIHKEHDISYILPTIEKLDFCGSTRPTYFDNENNIDYCTV